MVGGGIFAVLGVVAIEARGAAPLAFLVAGSVAMLTAVSYAKLSVAFPNRGGSVVFVDAAFGVSTATGALNNLLWFGYVVTLSLYAVAFGNYAATFFTSSETPGSWLLHALISAAIIVPTVLNLLGAGIVARTETAVVVVKLLMLAFVGGVGITTIQADRLAVDAWPSFPVVVAAGMLVFVAYEGFELIANAAEDVRDPRHTLPRAFYLSVGSVIVLYVAIAIVTIGSLAPKDIAGAADFALAAAAEPGLGSVGFRIVAASAVLATFSAINATLYGSARLSYAIAAEGELPPVLEKRVWSEPVGLFITAGVALVLANALNVSEISSVASAVFLIVFGTTNAAALKVARRVGASRIVSTLGVAGCVVAFVVLVVDTARHRPIAVALVGGAVAAAAGAEALWLRHRRSVGVTPPSDTAA
jgi:hypothetical protein